MVFSAWTWLKQKLSTSGQQDGKQRPRPEGTAQVEESLMDRVLRILEELPEPALSYEFWDETRSINGHISPFYKQDGEVWLWINESTPYVLDKRGMLIQKQLGAQHAQRLSKEPTRENLAQVERTLQTLIEAYFQRNVKINL